MMVFLERKACPKRGEGKWFTLTKNRAKKLLSALASITREDSVSIAILRIDNHDDRGSKERTAHQ